MVLARGETYRTQSLVHPLLEQVSDQRDRVDQAVGLLRMVVRLDVDQHACHANPLVVAAAAVETVCECAIIYRKATKAQSM